MKAYRNHGNALLQNTTPPQNKQTNKQKTTESQQEWQTLWCLVYPDAISCSYVQW